MVVSRQRNFPYRHYLDRTWIHVYEAKTASYFLYKEFTIFLKAGSNIGLWSLYLCSMWWKDVWYYF